MKQQQDKNSLPYDVTNKVAIITGGGQGLGNTIAKFLLAQGMLVAICGRTQATIDATIDELSLCHPNKIIGKVCDVGNSEQVTAFKSFVSEHFGRAQVIINNSVFGKESLVWQTTERDWDDVMDTNVKGYI